jgi:WD repeat-containing protein 68
MSLTPVKRKEIYKYEAPWAVYGMNWSVRPDKRFRLALGSFVEEYNNKVQIVMLDEESGEFTSRSVFDHPYPTTKIMWIPDTVTPHFHHEIQSVLTDFKHEIVT